MRVLVLGAGAMGGYFGGRLMESGADVTFLVRPKRKQLLEAQGIVIESPAYGDFRGPARAITAEQLAAEAPFDVVILSCKAYDLDGAIAAIAPAIKGDVAILPLLNGLAHMELLNKRFGAAHVWGGLAKVAAALAPDGAIKHLNAWRALQFGEQSGALTPRVAAFAAAFKGEGVKAEAMTNINHLMWEKIVQFSAVAGMTSLMRATIGEIVRAGGSPLLLEALAVNAEIATREGYPPSQAFLAEYHKIFSDPTIPFGASMMRDVERGGPTEGEHVIGHMVALAHKHGIAAKLLEVSYVHLKAYEQRRAAPKP